MQNHLTKDVPEISRKEMYQQVNARIKKNKTELMQDLFLMEKHGLWEEGGFHSLKDWALKEQGWGTRYADMHLSAARFMVNATFSLEQKKKLVTESQIRAISQVSEELQEQVMEELSKEQVSAGKIKETAKRIAGKVHERANGIADAIREDEVGYKIPQLLIAEWDRIKEINKEYRKSVSFVRSDMESKMKSGDIAFTEIRRSCTDHLNAAWDSLKLLEPYAVCTSCNGQAWFQKTKCQTCNGRGWLSRHYYDTFIERSLKTIL